MTEMDSAQAALNAFTDQVAQLYTEIQSATRSHQTTLADLTAQLQQRLAAQAVESAKVIEHLAVIAKDTQAVHRKNTHTLDHDWPNRLAEIARSAGETQAQTFGRVIAADINTHLSIASDTASRAAQHLERAARALTWKKALTACAIAASTAAVVIAGLWAISAKLYTDIRELNRERAELTAIVSNLKDSGGELDLARCKPGSPRLCVRIDPGKRFGANSDYAPVRFRKTP